MYIAQNEMLKIRASVNLYSLKRTKETLHL